MKKVLAVIFVAMFAFAVTSSADCGKCEAKSGCEKQDPVKDIVTLPVKTVEAVGDVITGQAGKDAETKPADKK